MAEAAASQACGSDRLPHGDKVRKHREQPFGGFRWRERIVAYGKRERFGPEFRITVEVRSETVCVLLRSHEGRLTPSRPVESDLTRQVFAQAKHSSGKEADEPGYCGHERVPHQEKGPTPPRVVITPIARVRADEHAPGQPGCARRGPNQQRSNAMRYRGQREVGIGIAGDYQGSAYVVEGPVVHAACHPTQAADARCANAPVIESQHRRTADGEITREAIVKPRRNACAAHDHDGRRRRRLAVRGFEPHPSKAHSVIRRKLDGSLVRRCRRIRLLHSASRGRAHAWNGPLDAQ